LILQEFTLILYPTKFEGTSDTPIWAAVRASSAAPGYFNDFLLGDTVHQDGGILTNNATQIAIHEAHRLFKILQILFKI
jgi:calcium-independent phospholipase A2-gamma